MKKHFTKFSLLLLLPLLISSLILGVKAHPGRTDSNGGHTDHDTGEYHYHHGYPAHNHNDTDGDGDLDCPYDFDDKTDHGSGGSNDGNNIKTAPNDDTLVEKDIVSKQTTISDVLKAMLRCLLPAIGIGVVISHFLFYIFVFLMGDETGCATTWYSFIATSIAAYILLIIRSLS